MSVSAYRCWAEIDLAALRGNLAWLRHRVGPEKKIITVVKADAYGHGLKQIAALLMQSGTDIFGVANLAEAHSILRSLEHFDLLFTDIRLNSDDVAPLTHSGSEPIRKYSR